MSNAAAVNGSMSVTDTMSMATRSNPEWVARARTASADGFAPIGFKPAGSRPWYRGAGDEFRVDLLEVRLTHLNSRSSAASGEVEAGETVAASERFGVEVGEFRLQLLECRLMPSMASDARPTERWRGPMAHTPITTSRSTAQNLLASSADGKQA